MSGHLSIHQWADLDDRERALLLQRPAASQDASVRADAEKIIAAVRENGDDALIELTQRFDQAAISDFRVSEAEISWALTQLTAE